MGLEQSKGSTFSISVRLSLLLFDSVRIMENRDPRINQHVFPGFDVPPTLVYTQFRGSESHYGDHHSHN